MDSFDAWSESVEEHFESVARSLKETLRTTPWIPDYMKSTPAPPARLSKPIRPPVGYIGASRRWISENRAVTAALIAFIGTGAFIVWRRRRSDKAKRRAKRTKHGARTEVVILSGSPHSPLTKSVSCELERRGFIIYIPVSSVTEEQVIQGESGGDIRPLNMDIASVCCCFSIFRKRVISDLFLPASFHRRGHREGDESATQSLPCTYTSPSIQAQSCSFHPSPAAESPCWRCYPGIFA